MRSKQTKAPAKRKPNDGTHVLSEVATAAENTENIGVGNTLPPTLVRPGLLPTPTLVPPAAQERPGKAEKETMPQQGARNIPYTLNEQGSVLASPALGNGLEVQVPEAAPQRERLPVGEPKQDANGTQAIVKRGRKLKSPVHVEKGVEAHCRRLELQIREQGKTDQNTANALTNAYRLLAQIKRDTAALQILKEWRKLNADSPPPELPWRT